MANSNRPLSPHLLAYRWGSSMRMSLIHRMSGVILSFGTVALVGWLVSIIAGYDTYSVVNYLFGSAFGIFALIGWTFCFFYHMCNGIRHMFWDVGKGFGKQRAHQNGMLGLMIAIILTIGLWVIVLVG